MNRKYQCFLAAAGAAVLLWTGAGAEEARVLLEENGLCITLDGCEVTEGEAVLHLLCSNDAEEARELLLITPQINGEMAGFDHGWGSCELTAEPGENISSEFSMVTDDPEEMPEILSFRFIEDGNVSSICRISLEEKMMEIASFAAGKEEPLLVDPEIEVSDEISSQGTVFTDTITPEQVQMLDYGRALICVKQTAESREYLSHISTVEAVADAEGHVTASFSGLALQLAEDPDFVIPTLENQVHRGVRPLEVTLFSAQSRTVGGTEDQDPSNGLVSASGQSSLNGGAENMALSGEAAFYATLSFQLRQNEEGGMTAEDIVVSSDELGGECGNIPCALFDTVQTSREIWSVEELSPDSVWLEIEGSADGIWNIEGPLRFRLVPAEELGEIVVCFEYFFKDGTDVIHPPEA